MEKTYDIMCDFGSAKGKRKARIIENELATKKSIIFASDEGTFLIAKDGKEYLKHYFLKVQNGKSFISNLDIEKTVEKNGWKIKVSDSKKK